MSPLRLPVALVAVDNAAHELTRLSIEDTLRVIAPKQVIIVTDDPRRISVDMATYVHFPNETGGGLMDAMIGLWYHVPEFIAEGVSHILWQQWDSWALDAARWTDEFLEYDYIGAPWPVADTRWAKLRYTEANNVGNGGFSLRSTELVKYICANPETIPLSLPEDDALCRHNRQKLVSQGFLWAPGSLARRFSCEFADRPEEGTFGYHAVQNWMYFMPEAERNRRIAMATPWVRSRKAFQVFLEQHKAAQKHPEATTYVYDPAIFNVTSKEHAQSIILTDDTTHSTAVRWEKETAWIYSLLTECFPQDNASLIDFGCGIGRISKPLIERRNFSALGLDISQSMCAYAVDYVNASRFLVSSPESLDHFTLWGARFDYALAVWSLQHSATPRDDIKRISAALKPAGRLFVLNTYVRFLPTRQGVWLHDGVDIWAMLEDEFRLIETHEVPETMVANPPSAWGVFEKR